MTKQEFKKYRINIITANVIFFVVMLGLSLLGIYNKNANRILFSDTFLPQSVQRELNIYLDHYGDNGFLFAYIWGFCIIFLLPFNINYFEEKNKLFGPEKTDSKKDKKFKKIVIYIFSTTTILNILFFIFALEENFVGKYGLSFSTETIVYSFLGITANIGILLSAIFL